MRVCYSSVLGSYVCGVVYVYMVFEMIYLSILEVFILNLFLYLLFCIFFLKRGFR